MWRPLSIPELEDIVAQQLTACTPSQQLAFAQYRVPFYKVPIHRLGEVEDVLVVAHLPGGLLYFEDIEEGFELSVLGDDGKIPEQGCNQYELCHVLTRAGL